jgi:hypothetical protein
MTSTFTDHFQTAAVHVRRRAYEQLWYEFTIVGRDVWLRNDLQLSEKLDRLKWLNDIQHRLWAHANAALYSATDLYATLQHHAAQASALREHLL